jgi:glycogen debranching enzyme
VVFADGSQVKQPKALCELQGYVYDAKTRMAEVFAVLGEEARARQLLQQAETLKQHFNAAFWMEDEGCYAFGLEPQKHQITSIAFPCRPLSVEWHRRSSQSGTNRPAPAARRYV